jgi:predicted GIY-YIG superfamily endonuclease
MSGRERTYYVYILTSLSGTLYTGVTNSLARHSIAQRWTGYSPRPVPHQSSCSATHFVACHSEGPLFVLWPLRIPKVPMPGRERAYYVYILTSRSGALYTGVTMSRTLAQLFTHIIFSTKHRPLRGLPPKRVS